MYAARFTVFYVIAALAAFATASPVPVAAPEPEARAVARIAGVDIVAREALPEADAMEIRPRVCRRWDNCI